MIIPDTPKFKLLSKQIVFRSQSLHFRSQSPRMDTNEQVVALQMQDDLPKPTARVKRYRLEEDDKLIEDGEGARRHISNFK